MRKTDMNKITQYCSSLSDDQLENYYHNLVLESLGSEAQIMEERGWDEADVRERRKYEKELNEQCDLIEKLCYDRGIDPWRDYHNADADNL